MFHQFLQQYYSISFYTIYYSFQLKTTSLTNLIRLISKSVNNWNYFFTIL